MKVLHTVINFLCYKENRYDQSFRTNYVSKRPIVSAMICRFMLFQANCTKTIISVTKDKQPSNSRFLVVFVVDFCHQYQTLPHTAKPSVRKLQTLPEAIHSFIFFVPIQERRNEKQIYFDISFRLRGYFPQRGVPISMLLLSHIYTASVSVDITLRS